MSNVLYHSSEIVEVGNIQACYISRLSMVGWGDVAGRLRTFDWDLRYHAVGLAR